MISRRVGMFAKVPSWTNGSPRLRAAIPHRPATSPTSRASPITGPDCGSKRTQEFEIAVPMTIGTYLPYVLE